MTAIHHWQHMQRGCGVIQIVVIAHSVSVVSVGVVFSPLCFLWGPGSMVQSDKR